jgi:hypothetical protein
LTRAAARAIIGERLRSERRSIAFACAMAAVAAFIQPHGIATITNPLIADVTIRSVWLAGPMFVCSTLGIALAILQGPGRHTYLDLSERSAPLFGRELARAKAAAPVIAATVTTLIYWASQYLTGFAAPPTFFVLALASVVAGTLVAMNATVRQGTAKSAAIVLAAATVVVSYLIALYADPPSPSRSDVIGVTTELIFCAIVSYVALREYGEALARYDPLA